MRRIERSVDLLTQSTQELLGDLQRVYASLTRVQRHYFEQQRTAVAFDEQATSSSAVVGGNDAAPTNALTRAMLPVRFFHSVTNMLHVSHKIGKNMYHSYLKDISFARIEANSTLEDTNQISDGDQQYAQRRARFINELRQMSRVFTTILSDRAQAGGVTLMTTVMSSQLRQGLLN
jgi:hypothetical protein